MEERRCFLVELEGLTSYADGLALQEVAFERVRRGTVDGILILLQHSPVFTIGKSGGRENLLANEETLRRLGIDVYDTTRGGNITYHGPGQIVAYPIFSLKKWKMDLPWFVTSLEEVVIRTLREYGIKAGRKPKHRGVWVGNKKIAAIGIAVKRWITMHGFAFNISVNKEHFTLINPCGIKEFGIVSLEDLTGPVDFGRIMLTVKEKFAKVFETNFQEVSRGWLESDDVFAKTGVAEEAHSK